LLNSPKGTLAIDTVVAMASVVFSAIMEGSRAVIQHLVIDGQVACFDRQQSVEDTATSDNNTVHGVLVV
jgi:hypothetical protein